MRFSIGGAYLLNVAPGWIFSAIIKEDNDDSIMLESATWLESVRDNDQSVFFAATNPDAISTAWPIPDGMQVYKHAILTSVPADERSIKSLYQRHAKQTINDS